MGTIDTPDKLPLHKGTTSDNLSGAGGSDGFGGFGQSFINQSVGRNQTNEPKDVWTASSFLHANNHLTSPTQEATEEFNRGIEAAQVQLNDLSDGGLRVDGIVRPWGPTEVLSQRAITSGKMHSPSLAEKPGESGKPASDTNPLKGASFSAQLPPSLVADKKRDGKVSLPPIHDQIPPQHGKQSTQSVLPKPHGILDQGQSNPPRSSAKPSSDNPQVLKRLGELQNILAKRRVEKTFEIDPAGNPTGKMDTDVRDDIVDFGGQLGNAAINLIDNLIMLLTRGQSPSAVIPTLNPKRKKADPA